MKRRTRWLEGQSGQPYPTVVNVNIKKYRLFSTLLPATRPAALPPRATLLSPLLVVMVVVVIADELATFSCEHSTNVVKLVVNLIAAN